MKHLRNVASRAKFHAAMLATAVLASPGFAMAAGEDFDGTEIITKIGTYTAVGVAILAAFAAGRWALRALGLIGGK